MGADLFHADGRTDWHAWRRVISFHNYAGEAVTFTITLMVDGKNSDWWKIGVIHEEILKEIDINVHNEWAILYDLTLRASETVLIYVVICDKCEKLAHVMWLKLMDVKLLIDKFLCIQKHYNSNAHKISFT